jgi:hypothetical protein
MIARTVSLPSFRQTRETVDAQIAGAPSGTSPPPPIGRFLTTRATPQNFFDAPVGSGHNRSSFEMNGDACSMLYAILCYHDEDTVGSWTKEQDAAVMTKLTVVQEKLAKQGRLGPVARLLPTTAATTVRKDDPPLVLDGPYAETKEQLLGFYVVDCKNLDEAVDVARELGAANPGGAYEIRPVGLLRSGSLEQ